MVAFATMEQHAPAPDITVDDRGLSLLPTPTVVGTTGGYNARDSLLRAILEDQPLGLEDAERLDARIRALASTVRDNLTELSELVAEARSGAVHVALGFASWTAYLADALGGRIELNTESRREVVAFLAGEGMSQRAIADIAGVSQKTVDRDLDHVSHHDSPDAVVTGLDGKSYPRRRPKERDPFAPMGEPVAVAVWDQRRGEWVTDRTDASGRVATFAESWPAGGHVRGGVLLVGADYARLHRIPTIDGWRGKRGPALAVDLALRTAERAVSGLAATAAGHGDAGSESIMGRLVNLRQRVDSVIEELTAPVAFDAVGWTGGNGCDTPDD